MLRETIEHHRQGRLEEAEKGYREELAANPDSSEALRGLSAVRRLRGDLAESAQLIKRAHELAPEQPKLLLMLGSIQLESGNIEGSRDAYERALALDPNLAGAHTALGHIAMMQGDAKLAEQYFRTALRVTEDPQALSGLGSLALDRGDDENALKYLARASDLAPSDPGIAYALGRGFAKRGMTAFAEQAFRNALRLKPGLPHASHALGQLLIHDKRAAEAEPYFRALHGVRGFELMAELGMGDAARMQDKHEEAIAAYQRALVLKPEHENCFEALIWSTGKLGRGEEVMALLGERITRFPEQLRWRATRARIHEARGRHAEAAADWQALRERDPQNAEANVELVRARERNGEFELAAELAEATVKLAASDPNLTLVRVRARMRRGEDAGARELLSTINLRKAGKDVVRTCQNLSGQLHDRVGETAEAVKDFRESQAGLPGMLPKLEALPAEAAAATAASEAADWAEAPILLLGVPGSGVERIAALLADQPGLTVLRDRIQGVRNDGFDTAMVAVPEGDIPAGMIAEQREAYLAPLRARGVDPSRTLVDWIPRFDAHHIIYAQRLLPGTRVIIVDRDARDCLLNWLAFGWLPYAGLNDFDACTGWLGRAVAHTRFVADHARLPCLVVNAEQVLADPAGAGAELARFVGVDSLTPGAMAARVDSGPGGLPNRFADGYWKTYAQTLADAFASLPEAENPAS
ncbi:tetratricopeptide repeat protein [Dokdonella immobilis]|uniref:Tfp pilus assembly protein PilF n=1 Tax=Dokdonella immobilis TaxID=578942 RepID=A0A1I4XWP7_9GAMM|nr:tetratricopeptide repeat protein [Dokdonella immobilis]SFN29803.1 Tfp pilus assembly protein PilF [Dokdonella immobilis]